MKKFTFFLSLFLTVSGVATTNAQNTFLQPDDIKDGRVITLKGSNSTRTGYMTMSKAGAEGSFDPNKTAVVVEAYENNKEDGVFYFYMKTISEGKYKYLEKCAGEHHRLTLADSKAEAALFHAVNVSETGSGDNQVTDADAIRVDGVDENDNAAKLEKVVRFVVSDEPDGNGTAATKGYLNFDGTGTQAPQYFTGKGSYSVFSVYDAVELCKQHYNYDDIISANSTDEIYVGDFVLPEENKNAVKDAYGRYDAQFSEANSEVVTASTDDIYTEIVTASDEAAKIIYHADFAPNLYYLIENNWDKGNYMKVADNQVLAWEAGISNSASQIWQFEATTVTTENGEEQTKYFMSTQGVFCTEPVDNIQVTLSDDETKRASFYMIETSTGVYAFDSALDREADRTTNKGKGLNKGGNNRVVGWGTAAGLSKWKLKYARTYTVVMPNEGWTTLNLPFAVSLPENLTALYPTDAKKYTYTDEENDNAEIVVNSVTMTELTDKKIPANFPVVLQGEAGRYTLTILSADEDVSTGDRDANKFTGVLLPKTVNTATMFNLNLESDSNNFTLSSEFEKSEVTVAANSAYIPFSSVTTGITDVVATDTNADNVWFDLVGRRVLNPAKGVYVNAAGKKALFK